MIRRLQVVDGQGEVWATFDVPPRSGDGKHYAADLGSMVGDGYRVVWV